MPEEQWRTRKHGKGRQIGTHFKVTERGDKRNLPTDMKQVTPSLSRKERLQRKYDLLIIKLARLVDDIENKVSDKQLEEMDELSRELEQVSEELKH